MRLIFTKAFEGKLADIESEVIPTIGDNIILPEHNHLYIVERRTINYSSNLVSVNLK